MDTLTRYEIEWLQILVDEKIKELSRPPRPTAKTAGAKWIKDLKKLRDKLKEIHG